MPWASFLSSSGRALLLSLSPPQEGLPQSEPRFSVVNVPVSSLYNTQMFKMHRNIIICDVKAGTPDEFYIHPDQWAEPQAVIDIAASSEASLCEMLRKHAGRIVEEIYKDEYRRMDRVFYKDRNVELMKRVNGRCSMRVGSCPGHLMVGIRRRACQSS